MPVNVPIGSRLGQTTLDIEQVGYGRSCCSPCAPLLATGCQSSGTTLIAEWLGSHERSAFGVEWGIIRTATLWFSHCRGEGDGLRWARFDEYARLTHSARSGPEYDSLGLSVQAVLEDFITSESLYAYLNHNDVDGFIRDLCYRVHIRRCSSALFWGDKYPEYCLFLPRLLDIFPNAKFVFIVRHPYDVIYSLATNQMRGFHRLGEPRQNLDDCKNQWISWNTRWTTFRDRLSRDAYLELRYEDALAAPRTAAVQLGDLIGVDLLDSPAFVEQLSLVRNEKHTGKGASQLFSQIRALAVTEDMERLCRSFDYHLCPE